MDKKMSFKVDWLTMTYRFQGRCDGSADSTVIAADVLNVLGVPVDHKWTAGGKEGFYRWTWQIGNPQISISVAEDLENQGVKVVMSGKVLSRLNASEVIRNALYGGFRITRCDVAIDLYGFEYKARELGEFYNDEHRFMPVRKTQLITSPRGGDTFYIGSRQSDRMYRIYDKGAEQGNDDLDWLRIEGEFKGDLAVSAALAASGEGFTDVVGDFVRVFDCPDHPVIVGMVEIPGVENGSITVVSDDRVEGLGWWERSVVPALVKMAVIDVAKFEVVRAMLLDALEAVEMQ
jgi:hypothetical protein